MAARIDRAILRMLAEREGSICPSEIARKLRPEGDWRGLMPRVREVAARMAERGQVEVQQGGKRVHARRAKGPIRIRIKGT